MNDIVRPLTADKQIGFDQFDQLLLKVQQGDWWVTRATADLRGESCVICGKPWELSAASWEDHYDWRRYDEHAHLSCVVKYFAMKDRDQFFDHFAATDVAFRFEPISNQYIHPRGPNDHWAKRHWYRFWLVNYPVQFVVGLRKRVVSIAVTPQGPSLKLDWHEKARDAFENEDVTKTFGPNEVLLHAWTREKEREYITTLCKLIAESEPDVAA